MKTKNLPKLLLLMFVLAAFTVNAQGITYSKWQIHEGKGPIDFKTENGFWGDPAAYKIAEIPAVKNNGWTTVEDQSGKFLSRKSYIPPFTQVDFTYFQTIVNVPQGTIAKDVKIAFGMIDDGARVYVFNSKYPNGKFKTGTDFLFRDYYKAGNRGTAYIGNFADLMIQGINRIVIVQFDNSKDGNHVNSVSLEVGGKIIPAVDKDVAQMESSQPIGHWTFENGSRKDKTGNFGDLKLSGAAISNGQLYVGKGTFAQSSTYKGPNIKEKTLVAWATIVDTTNQGGSVLTIGRSRSNYDFDAIVFGERQSKTWEAGSGWYNRTQDIGSRAKITDENLGREVKIAISYGSSQNGQVEVKVYQNDIMIGSYIKGSPLDLSTNKTGVIFGKRHFYGGLPNKPWVDASIQEARVYSGVLTAAELKQLSPEK